MREVVAASQTYTFGPFELRSSPTGLFRDGTPVEARPQTLQLLGLLLVQAGSLVSRREIRERLWGDGRTVEFERSINTAMRDLRRALGETYEEPAYIETVPRQGYRFISPVQVVEKPLLMKRSQPSKRWLGWSAAAAFAIVSGAVVLSELETPEVVPEVSLETTTALLGGGELSRLGRELLDELHYVLSVHYADEMRLVRGERPQLASDSTIAPRGFVLESSVSSFRSEEMTISVRLIDRADRSIIWTEVYRVEPTALAHWPDEAGRDVARAIVELSDF